MIVRYFSIVSLQLATLVSLTFASELRWSVLSSGICTMIIFPLNTHQWSLLGLNLWPIQTIEEPSNGFDLNSNPISRGKVTASMIFSATFREIVFATGPCFVSTTLGARVDLARQKCECWPSHHFKTNFYGTWPILSAKSLITATCDQEVQNNLTYVTSPGFPNLIDWPMNCSVVVRKIDRQVSQLRIDFVHFNIGQPNPRTGVCDEDIMEIRNGKSVFQLCGWNSGQHLYIDVDENNQSLTLDFQLPRRIQPRMWEIRIVQLAFEQRAPTGCLQYFQSPNGTLKTLNFLLNGRFLANQDYLMCIRQERGMCGIAYMPCSSDSFRIGPPRMQNMINNTNVNASSIEGNSNMMNSTMQNATNMISMNNTDSDIEGSGINPMDDDGISGNATSMGQESAPSSGIMGQERCRNRVLIPCDFEEFITPGNNEAGICNLEHCGNSLCDRNELDEEGNCRVETWATPFRIRVAFGPGQYTGTTLEDNIGMCLMYEQLPCVA
ncbi:uncharacterized protein LOC114878669 [Osmia bicornis bicornis]|uniref:uncharacterized protein LOC114878669 n=1 Tax=Osmia bicornis bicornis TaxID=1437191 RepID=UPI001EAE871E|nr:uncharacterized protein LOC114878669 [Osmia bicornis bicornis]